MKLKRKTILILYTIAVALGVARIVEIQYGLKDEYLKKYRPRLYLILLIRTILVFIIGFLLAKYWLKII